ncbi:hypothetical protein [Parabacteroides goldsteinii]
MTEEYFDTSDFKEVSYSVRVPETYSPIPPAENRDFTNNTPPPPPPSGDK